jgi:signal transduction histidine kinase
MRYFDRFRSLHTYVLLWLFIPFAVLLIVVLASVISIYQNSMTQLVLERHQQLANLAAVTISQGMEGNAHVLEALSTRATLRDPSRTVRESVFQQSSDALENFNAGVIQVDAQGMIITIAPGTSTRLWETIPVEIRVNLLKATNQPTFSNVVTTTGDTDVVLVAVPVTTADGQLASAIIGGIDLNDPVNVISEAIQKLTTSTPGIAYLVDAQGKVISHPQLSEIGKDYRDRPYIGQAVLGSRGGRLWTDPTGERFVGAEALVSPSGWSVVIKEPWEVITASARGYTILIIAFVLLALVGFLFISWIATRRVTAPIQKLSKSTGALASGEVIPPMDKSRILEIDNLHASFMQMANQIASYRDGLRHYVDVLTRSQEDERLRIARELHDETVQNLLAIYRRMELYAATETDPQRKEQLGMLHAMTHKTLQGVRRISQDLRPMMLDDLGFLPAVQMLVRAAHEGPGGVPHVDFEVKGDRRLLAPAHELALYRIIQEALQNVRKHAHATRLLVKIAYQTNLVCLEITDDGLGFAVPASFTELVQAGNLGLMGIQERVWAVGGTLNIDSRVGKGTEIKVSLFECQHGRL